MRKLLTLLIITLFVSGDLFADWGNEQKVSPSDGGYTNRFGYSVFISGDFAVMGAPFDSDNGIYSGSAYIYHYNGYSWSQQTKLLASDGDDYDTFGHSVSISGDYAVIGAYGDNDNGNNSGSAYIYYYDGSSWSEQVKLIASDGNTEAYFGNSVSISGNFAVIGAYEDYDWGSGTDSGSAYIYYYDGSSWSEQAKLLASDSANHDRFGYSVSISENYVVIGAYEDDDNGTDSGSAYIFYYNGTSWSEQAKLTASDGSAEDHFGNSVCIFGDYVVIGAIYDGNNGNGNDSGSAYIYYYEGSNWTEHVKLFASDGEVGDHFGNSVSISGDYTVIGAYGDNDYGFESGSAYLFYNDDSNWSEQMKLTASDGATFDYFGNSVSISGDYAVIGAYGDSDYGSASGSAYFYENLNSAITPFTVQCIEYPILKSAYPNPFNPTTTISFSIPEESNIELSIYNIKGQKIKSLLSDQMSAGEHSIIWDGKDISGKKVGSGIYLYKLNVNGKTEAVRKCLLLK